MAAGTSLGSAYVQIVPSADGIKGSITNVLNGEAESAGTSSGNKIASFVKKAIKAAAVGKFLKDSLQQGAELEQNIGGAHAVFGDKLYGDLETRAKVAYKNMGLSASDYYATANKMGSLFQGSGLSQQKSLDLTTSAMQRAADVASVMGIDTSMAMESIAGAAKGNFTMMDNLGVAMNATTLAAYALEKGINFDWNTASNAEKAELAMQMFMDRTSQYAGNFARESADTFSGSLGALKASYQDFVGQLVLGEDLSGSMDALLESVLAFGKNLIKAFGNILLNLPESLGHLGDLIMSKIDEFSNNPAIGNAAAEFIKKFVVSLVTNLPKLLAAIAGLVGVAISTLVQTAGTLIKPAITAIANKFGAIKTALSTKAAEAIATLRAKFAAAKAAILQPFENARDKVKAIVDKIKGFFKFKVSTPHVPLPHFGISPSGWKIGDLLKGVKPSLSVKWFAEGGILDSPTLFGAGEAGPEAVMPLDRLREFTAIDYDRLASALVKALSSVNTTTTVEVDGREIARTTAPFMETELNRIQTRANRKLGYI